jgi:two-component system, NtrC family, nitrogen regulation response regulator GlnG
VRVIAATHQDLEERVKQGVFREDLFHRLNVIRLRLPALRERREDVPMLARYFLQRSAQQLGVEPKRISEAAMDKLGQFQFPGNVRQLENICHWLTVMAPAQVIEFKDLPPEVLATGVPVSVPDAMPTSPLAPEALSAPLTPLVSSAGASSPSAVWESGLEEEALAMLNAGRTDVWDVLSRRFETSLIQAALSTTRGRRIEAAQKLGIGRNTITRKIQELGIDE